MTVNETLTANGQTSTPLTTGAGAIAAAQLESAAVGLPLSGMLADLAAVLRDLDGGAPDATRIRQWAAVDLFGVFLGDGNDTETDGPQDRTSRNLEVAVRALVFAPIVWTWAGLTAASIAYRAAVTVGALHSESFLQGWETGFGGRLFGLFVFDKLAFGTSLLVAALIGVTVWHAMRTHQVEERVSRRRHRLTAALLRADLLLAPYRLPANEQATLEIETVIARLVGTVGAIEAAGQVASNTQSKAADAVAAATAALTAVERAVTSAASAAVSLEKAPDRLAKHLNELATTTARIAKAENDLVDATGDASAQIAGALREGADQVRDSVATVGAAAANYATRTELAADILGQARQAVDALPVAVTALRAEVTTVGSQLSGLTQALTAVASLQRSVDAMRQSLDAAHSAVRASAAPQKRGFLYRLLGRRP
jgi:uncharacterized membrane protein